MLVQQIPEIRRRLAGGGDRPDSRKAAGHPSIVGRLRRLPDASIATVTSSVDSAGDRTKLKAIVGRAATRRLIVRFPHEAVT
jgi:hypothetical protein